MYTKAELQNAINELQGGAHTLVNCEKLAALYTVLDHIDPLDKKVIERDEIGEYGKSDFLQMIAGKPEKEVFNLIDELVDALAVFNPKLHTNFFDKLREIRG